MLSPPAKEEAVICKGSIGEVWFRIKTPREPAKQAGLCLKITPQ